jgi:acyl dehydratase
VSAVELRPTISVPLHFEDLEEGMRWVSLSRTVTEADVLAYIGLSGDVDPMVLDVPRARTSGHDRAVVPPLLVLSIVTGLRQQLGVFYGTLHAGAELRSWRLHQPVLVGDTVTSISTVQGLRAASGGKLGVVEQGIDVCDQDGMLVQSGEFVTLFRRRSVDTSAHLG